MKHEMVFLLIKESSSRWGSDQKIVKAYKTRKQANWELKKRMDASTTCDYFVQGIKIHDLEGFG